MILDLDRRADLTLGLYARVAWAGAGIRFTDGAMGRMRQARADGAAGIKLSDVLPIGASVEVRYEERAGKRYARTIVLASSGR